MSSVSRLTVLGSCACFPEPGRACNGFLLEHQGYAIALDLGYGTLGNLLRTSQGSDLDAVVVSHEHPDHCIDLHALFRSRLYAIPRPPPLPLLCPPGVLARLDGIEPDVDLRTVFDVTDLPSSADLGPFRFTSVGLPHFVDNVGTRLESQDFTVACTGDTARGPRSPNSAATPTCSSWNPPTVQANTSTTNAT
jgi:ribonuclease BN (tRNA processing enzyme)